MIAHFGTGLIGARFARAALERGEDVAVWNRLPQGPGARTVRRESLRRSRAGGARRNADSRHPRRRRSSRFRPGTVRFADFKLTGAIENRGKNMAEGNDTPAWELTMAGKDVRRKDVRLMLDEGALHDVAYDVLPLIAAVFDRAIAAGHAQDVGVVTAR